MQSAYRIMVSRDDEWFGSGSIVWDTRKMRSSVSIQHAYEGVQLDSQTTYYWRVKLWDESGCVSKWSDPQFFHTGFLGDDGFQAGWIGATCAGVRSPLFRKTFEVDKPVRSAFVYAASIGLNELYMNGEKVGDHLFEPAASQYTERLLYTVYDVSEQVNQGINAIGVWMGEGMVAFTEPMMGRFAKPKFTIDPPVFSRPKLLFEMRINYMDGSHDLVASNGSWRWSGSAILYNNFYGGEDYDARLEQAGWSTPLFDDSHWENVSAFDYSGRLSACLIQPVKELTVYDPVTVLRRDDHTYEYDFGVTIGGYWEIEVEGQAGASVMVRGTEKCGGNVYQKPLTDENHLYWDARHSSAGVYFYRDCYSLYTLKGEGTERYKPRFFYQGFRYLQVRVSDPEQVRIRAVRIIETNNAIEQHGTFNSSDEYLNRIHTMVAQTFRNNFIQGIPLSNPHSEKFGWTGDVHLFSEAADYTYDMAAFWTKWVNDFPDAQQWAGESGLVPVVVPYMLLKDTHKLMVNDVSWVSVYPHLVWQMYMHHLDTALIRKHYEPIKKYHEFVLSSTQRYIATGRWGDHMMPHSSLDIQGRGGARAPEIIRLINTAYLYRVTATMERMAEILHKEHDQAWFRKIAGKIFEAFNLAFFNKEKGFYMESPGPEGYLSELTANLVALQMGLVPDELRGSVVSFVKKQFRSNDYRALTGILGTWAFIDVLRDEDKEFLHRIVMNREYPGWGYFLEKLQATTLNQRWTGRGDYNHCMLGGINAFFYRDLLGIRIDVASSEGEIVIHPFIPEGLTEASGRLHTAYGEVASGWTSEGNGVIYKLGIPANTRGVFVYPDLKNNGRLYIDDLLVVEGNRVTGSLPGWIKSVDAEKDNKLVLGSGDYTIFVSSSINGFCFY
ncbi:MAG: family 78 glycoside hydrolase catalytic domain [Kiritimatiellia bacterium]